MRKYIIEDAHLISPFNERARDLRRETAGRASHERDLAAEREERLELAHGESTTFSAFSL